MLGLTAAVLIIVDSARGEDSASPRVEVEPRDTATAGPISKTAVALGVAGTTNTTTAVRAAPGARSRVFGTVPRGTTLQIDGRTDEDGWLLRLGDVYASQPKSVGLRFHVEDVETLAEQVVAEVIVRADVISDEGVTRRIVTLPVMATLDGQSRVEPVVEETFLRYAMARARREATERADQGDIPALLDSKPHLGDLGSFTGVLLDLLSAP